MATLLIRPLRPSNLLRFRAPLFRTAHIQAMAFSFQSYLVSPSELNDALRRQPTSSISTAPRIVPVSAAWFLPNDSQKRTGWSSFITKRIPRSRFFDLDKVKDEDSPYPHMLPTPDAFAKEIGRLGIRREDTVVIYDTAELGIFSAPRVAWTFRVFGHEDVHLLNSFKRWVDEGLPVEEGPLNSTLEAVEYPTPELNKNVVVAFEEVKEKVSGNERVQILDARPEGRWKGSSPEPRPGLSSGHMPNSTSIPHSALLDPDTGGYLPASKLREVFARRGITKDVPIISSCGTGVTAAVVDAALAEAGFPQESRRIYDGSWTEWAQRVNEDEGLIVKEPS